MKGDKMELPIVIDFVCPYCYYLVALLDTVRDTFPHTIRFLPNERTEEGRPPVDVCSDPERRARFGRTLAPACEKIGLDIKLPPNVCPRPYTQKAFEGFHFAAERGLGNEYCRRVMRAYFAEERDIGSEAVLAELAGEIGLDPALFLGALKDGTYRERQRQAVRYAKETVKVEVVPTILLPGGRVQGFFPSGEELVRQIREKSGA